MTDPTPETPFTVRDRIVAALSVLMGGADLETIRSQMYNALMRTTTQIHFPWLSSIDGRIAALDERIDRIQSVLGAEPYSSTETGNIRAILLSIMYGQNQLGISPDGNLNDYSQSFGSYSADGRRYITWNAIAGLTKSSDNIQLTPNASWDGYKIYIQTSAPSAILHDITNSGASIDPFPVNSWVSLGTSTDTLSWSVDASYQVTAYLQVPYATVSYITTDIRIHDGGRRAWFAALNPTNDYAYINGDYYGFKFRAWDADNNIISPLTCAYYATGGGNVQSVNYPATIPVHTTSICVQNAVSEPVFVKAELYKPVL